MYVRIRNTQVNKTVNQNTMPLGGTYKDTRHILHLQPGRVERPLVPHGATMIDGGEPGKLHPRHINYMPVRGTVYAVHPFRHSNIIRDVQV